MINEKNVSKKRKWAKKISQNYKKKCVKSHQIFEVVFLCNKKQFCKK